MDQPGHPDSGPAGAGDESRDAPTGGWQPSSNGRLRDANGRDTNGRDTNGRGDGMHRVPGTRTADTPWSSAGAALEPMDDDSGWRRSLTSGLRGRAEVRSRYADLLAPVSPALPPTPPRPGDVPASAPPYPYEGDLDNHRPGPRAWPPMADAGRPPAARTTPPAPSGGAPALTDNTYDDLPALAQEAAAASRAAQAAANAAAAVQAAREAEAVAKAHAVAEDHAAVQAAYRAAVVDEEGGPEEIGPSSGGRAPLPPTTPPDPRVPGGAPAEFRPPSDFRRAGRAFGEHRAPIPLSESRPARGISPVPLAPAPPAPALIGGPGPVEPARGGVAPLPQRIPAPPDVPEVPDDALDDQFIEPPEERLPELARIATHLRHDEDREEPTTDRPDGFDVNTVLAAVRLVPGVRDAQLRPNPGGVHTLRLDLADGADPAQVSRLVARLLKQKMGLAAEPRRNSPLSRNPPVLPRDPGLPKDAIIPGAPPAPRSPAATSPPPTSPPAAAPPAAAPPPPAAPPPAPPPPAGTATGSAVVPAPAERPLPVPDERRPSDPAQLPAHDERTRHRVTPARNRDSHPEEPRRVVRSGITGRRVVIDQVLVSTLGVDATVEVRLTSTTGTPAYGVASGPAADGYVLRLAAVAATNAIDQLLAAIDAGEQGRSYVEHAAVVPFGTCEVAVVVVLLLYGGTIEQLTGSALVSGDPRQAVVRATLAAVNRRLDGLLN